MSSTGDGIALSNLLGSELESAKEAVGRLERDLRTAEEAIADLAATRQQVAARPEEFEAQQREEILARSERLHAHRAELQTWLKAAVERIALVQAVSESLGAELEGARAVAADGNPPPLATRPPSALEIHEAVESERLRIARDLHDGPAQVLSNLVLEAEILERLLKRDPELVQAEIQDFRNSVTNAVADVRRFMFDLRPDSLDDLGLIATLRRFTSEWQQRTGVTCRLNLTGEDRRLPPRLEEALYRIVQEGLTNVRRHAEAKLVEVALDIRSDRVRIGIRDDGRGFDPGAPPPAEGPRRLGLMGMQERAVSVGGSLVVRAQKGAGTEVEGDFPVPTAAANPS